MKIGVGLVGLGHGEKVHLPAFRSLPSFELRAVASASKVRAAAVAGKYGIPDSYTDWRELVDNPRIDCVAIATPPDLQPRIALAALKARKAVFCEKPLAVDARDARRLLKAARKARVAHMLGLGFPEIPEWREAKKRLDGGSLGKLRHLTVTWQAETAFNRDALRSWKSDLRRGGGILHYYLAHFFHYAEWFAGPVTTVSARLYRMPGDRRSGHALASISLETESAAVVNAVASTEAFAGSGHRLEFYGDKGSMRLLGAESGGKKFGLWVYRRPAAVPEKISFGATGQDPAVEAMQRQLDRFADWILKGRRASPSFEEGWRVQRLMDAALASSARRGRRVRVKA